MGGRSGAAVWFGRVTWTGILVNLALAIPTLLAPERVLALSGAPPAVPLVWVRFSALLLILLSVFYVPAARDPHRYLAVAWLAVLARAAGAAFFGPQPGYSILGLLDFTFFVPEAILLAVAQVRVPVESRQPRGEVV